MLLEKDFSFDTQADIGQRRLLDVDANLERVTQLVLKYPVALCSIKVRISV
jgi:hypothetical protein